MGTALKSVARGRDQDRRELLAERLRKTAAESARSPLSFAQQRLWFLDRLEPNSTLYNIGTVARMKGALDAGALERSLQAIIARHEALRTRFVCTEGNPEQVVDELASLTLRMVDLEKSNSEEVDQLIREEVNRPFDLSADLLVRATLLRFGREEHLLILTMHHIVADEWSLKIFFNELATFYEGFAQGKEVLLPELPIQYADYAVWQREWLEEEVLEKQLEFWKEQLGENPPLTELPTDRARSAEPSFRGRSQSRVLGGETSQIIKSALLSPTLSSKGGEGETGALDLSKAVKGLAGQERATLFMLLLAALETLIYRYTGQEDVIVGTPIASRNRFELEGLIGFFVNTLPLRTKLEGNPTFRELVARVRDVTLGAYARQEIPFEKLVEELHPERSLSHLPFTRVMFAVQQGMLERMQLGEVLVEFPEVESSTSKFDFTLVVQETSGGLVAKAEYNTDLFEDETITRLLEHFEVLLKGMVEDPDKRLSELPLLTEGELKRVLTEWNGTETDYPRDKGIAELFEEKVRREPEAVAVMYGEEAVTYGELNARANQVAHYLSQFQIGPDVPVGICVERSVEMVVGVLGIIKAGGAYVPLDVSYPRERLAFMLRDIQAPVLLTQQKLVSQLPDGVAKVICLDADWEMIARESRENPAIRSRPEHLAYVMYTSGSTGEPKGVAVPQRAVNRLVLNTNYIELDSTDRIAQVSNFSFDAVTFEIWGALLNGARLVGIGSDVALSPKDFARELREQKITAMFLTSALFNQVAREAPGAFETLRTVMAGGEALDPKWVREVLKDRPPQRLVNGYGPTENTTFTCCHLIREAPENANNIPIGRPISNTQVYVLDSHLNPVAIGVPGELYAAGDGLARGYWQRPELTAAKFVQNPFRKPLTPVLSASDGEMEKIIPSSSIVDGQRPGWSKYLYRTGDLARWLADGTIEFLGRIDDQVKIRGFRIELGEIETVLVRHEGVAECVVKVCGSGAENKRLVAYIVPSGEGTPNVSELRAFLKEKLPDYMAPSAFVPMKGLPLTSNGKVDRKALPEPDQERPEQERKYAAPRDQVETELSRIWESVLGVHPVGIEDRFFDLGGHSLLAVRLMAQIEKSFGKKLRLATIFQRPTIELLAAVIRDELDSGSARRETSLVEIQSKGSRPPLFLVHGAGGGMFWGYGNLSRRLGPVQPVYGFKSRGLDGREEFRRIEEMASAYIADLRAVQPQGPYYLGGYCFGGNVAYEMACQLRAQQQEVGLLTLMNCAPPNSSYTKVQFTLTWFARFLRNLFYWGGYFKQWTPAQRREFFRWKWARFKKKFFGWTNQSEQSGGEIESCAEDVGDLVDLSSFSNEERALWETHIRALLNYHPKPYPGRVHLFRSPGHPLWCSFEPDYGWRELAKGGVNIRIVPGVHEKILEEPCVEVVAAELEKLVGNEEAKGASEIADRVGTSEIAAPEDGRTPTPGPLSFAQQRLWFLNQLEPGESVYNQVAGVHFKGALNVEALEKVLNEIVRRHEVLRTVFPAENGKPAQRVLPAAPLGIQRVELMTAERDGRAVSDVALEEKKRPFDLARDRLFRPVLVQLEEREHVLVLVAHEMVADRDSMGVILREICTCYEALCAGKDLPSAKLPARYSDFAAWQRERASAGAWDEDLKFWREQLQGAPALLELPTDRARPAKQSYHAASEVCVLPKNLKEEVKAFSRREGVSESTVFLAALKLLLRRYIRQEEIVIGVPIANREGPEFKNLAGNFENLLVVRTKISGDPTMGELLELVGKTTGAAMQHSEVPFERVLEEVRLPADQSYHPLCQVIFRYQDEKSNDTLKGGLPTRLETEQSSSKYDLVFQVEEKSGGLALRIVYATDLFARERIKRMAGHWENALKGVLEQSERHLSDISLLSSEEAELEIVKWNETQTVYPKEKTLTQLFDEQAERTPEREALVCGDTRLTYGELYARAATVAEHLRGLGVGKETLVGVCLERSWEMVAGILGTLQAGGAYVPMDPAYPKERLGFMLEDAQMRVLLTQRSLMDSFPKTEAQVVCVEDIKSKVQASKSKGQGPRAEDLAYVIYTSGSTGKPKGVALEHRNAAALVCWAKEIFTKEELSGVLASTSICFDLSVFEMFVPLCWGGKVILAENALALPGLAAAREVKLINTVPSALRELLRVKGIPPSVQVVNLAGEPLASSLVDEIYHETNAQKVYDLYGPTETTTYSTCALRKVGEGATIGRPLANEQIYLLDEYLQPTPIGVPGELHIGGVGVTRGYLNRPELTAERFITSPFKPGERLYKTGDLARWREDGNLEFLGRLDHQVKIRGFRIELGEIQAALKRCPGVSEAVVIAREDQPGNKRLVAYVAVTEGRGSEDGRNPDELRRRLRETLPEYMVPSAFVFLEALPLTPNGKVDRRALPTPEAARSGNEIVAPRTEVERQVAGIWREVIGLKELGVTENFFDLGGHSLLAIQVISRMREVFGVEVPLLSLFETPTIAGLAKDLEAKRWAAIQAIGPKLERIEREGNLPASFVQERYWFLDQLEPGTAAYHVPAAIRLKGKLDLKALERAFEEVIGRHEALRTSLQQVEGNLTQVIAPAVRLDIGLVDLKDAPESEKETRAREAINAEAQRPFDLAQGPLIRARLARLDEEEHVLVVVMHHTVADGWSLPILFRELAGFYDAYAGGKTAPQLPELPVQYADFASWQRRWMQGAVLEKELGYWKEKLAGAPMGLDLPVDGATTDTLKGELQTARRAGRWKVQVPERVAAELLKAGHAEGETPFMVLMAAMAITLWKWTGQKDLVIGTVTAGRDRREIENVIGCFVNFLPIRLTISGTESGQEFLGQARKAVLEAQTHQDCPFEKMVEAINPERRLNQNPLYNVGLLLQNFLQEPFPSQNLQPSSMPVAIETRLLDLRLEAEQTADGLSLMCEYDRALFRESTVEQLLTSYEQILERLLGQPQSSVAELEVTAGLKAQAKAAKGRIESQTIAIAATFTAEPVEEGLRYWMKELEVAAEVEFAPYNQVFQQLLDPGSLLSKNQRGLNVLFIRLEDWTRRGPELPGGPSAEESLERNVEEFVSGLKGAVGRASAPFLVCLCPGSEFEQEATEGTETKGALSQGPQAGSAAMQSRPGGRNRRYGAMARRLAAELEALSGVYVLTSEEVRRWYPVNEYYDARGDDLGHVPYTPVFFTALATAVVRKFHALKRPGYKVIVLDCDQTLWSGVCGEEGPRGVRLEPERIALQQFMRAQREAGMLLCVCSKNNEEDALEVFKQRSEMRLRQEDITAWRLNWQPKSENLKSLAEELQLGLDSFILIDDNPVECAEVEANCPEVLTLLLPAEMELIPKFLQHCWVFDHLKVTGEDRKRGEMYRENQQREQLRAKSLSMADFVAGLELKVRIEGMSVDQLPRVAQLTQRTNQFNFTTRRRTAAEIEGMAGLRGESRGSNGRAAHEVLTVTVSDRFGDYGLVGVMIYQSSEAALVMDTFLLSCRVLGRGVEHRMLARLGEIARERGLNWVDAHFAKTPKNKPALDFLESVGGAFRQPLNGGYLFRLPAGFAAEVGFYPKSAEAAPTASARQPYFPEGSVQAAKFSACRRIAQEANDAAKIHQRMEGKTASRSRGKSEFVGPHNEMERRLCEIWEKLLRVERVGVRDNFFELGGHSLLAVRLFAELEGITGQKLPLVTLFQAPTIEQLARQLCEGQAGNSRSLLVPLQPHGSKPPLFLVHGAGGDVLWGYANLAAHMKADQPIYGIKSRGQAGLEEFRRVEEMARYYLEEVRAFQPRGPYCLGGYCFGGNVAYEMARQLEGQGEKVALVALLDSAPSNAGYERAAWWRPVFGYRFAKNFYYWLEDFEDLKPQERYRFIVRKARALERKIRRRLRGQATEPTVDLEDVIDPAQFPENELRLWQIHLQALVEHVDKSYGGPVTLFRTRGQPLLCSFEEDFCWSKLARGGLRVKRIRGSHENIFMEPNVKFLAKELEECLEEAMGMPNDEGSGVRVR